MGLKPKKEQKRHCALIGWHFSPADPSSGPRGRRDTVVGEIHVADSCWWPILVAKIFSVAHSHKAEVLGHW
jgi:hypothetical protein